MVDVALEKALIAGVSGRQVLNTHLDWTVEFTVTLADGRTGRGASPRGETPSIYEDRETGGRSAPDEVLKAIAREVEGVELDQAELDALLLEGRAEWGAAATYAMSSAFYEATRPVVLGRTPRILFNVLNGGLHAYTNPIVSDCSEFLLVARSDDLAASVAGYVQILGEAKGALAELPTTTVGGNRVHDLGRDPNLAGFALLERLLADTGLSEQFGLMADASAGDWFVNDQYELSVSGTRLEPGALVEEWLRLMDRFDLEILEDPFAETDVASWADLHRRRPERSHLYGDNLTSVQPAELAAKSHLVDGVLVKPDQNGTVTGTAAIRRACAGGGALHRRLAPVHRDGRPVPDSPVDRPRRRLHQDRPVLGLQLGDADQRAAARSERMTAARTITTIRHSTTAHNASQIISGRLDEPLSDAGRALARELRELLGPLSADTVASSPMLRARETAAIVTTVDDGAIVTSELCVERSYGVLEGIPPEEVATYADRITYIERGGIRHSLNPPGGESFEEVRSRAERALEVLLAVPGPAVILVAHQTFLQQLHGLLLGHDVHDALALDIRTLQVDRFELNGAGPAMHEAVHPGMGTHRSW